MGDRKKLGLAGILLAGAISTLSPNVVYASNSENKVITFDYQSNRKNKEGSIFRYQVLNDNTISQANNPEVKFARNERGWFYDIDGDGKFGEAELNAIKSGKGIYMHPEFSKIADSKLKELESQKTLVQNKLAPEPVAREERYLPSTEQYLLSKLEEVGLDYDGWLNGLKPKEQKVFTNFAEGLIEVVDGLPEDYLAYAQEKFERLLATGDVKGAYGEIKQDILNLPEEEYNTFMSGLKEEVKRLDDFLVDNSESVEKIAYSFEQSPVELKQTLGDLEKLYLNDLYPLTLAKEKLVEEVMVAEKPVAPEKLEEKVVSEPVAGEEKYVPSKITSKDVIGFFVQLEPTLNELYVAPKFQQVANESILRIIKFYNTRTQEGKEMFLDRINEISSWYKGLSSEEKSGLYELLVEE